MKIGIMKTCEIRVYAVPHLDIQPIHKVHCTFVLRCHMEEDKALLRMCLFVDNLFTRTTIESRTHTLMQSFHHWAPLPHLFFYL